MSVFNSLRAECQTWLDRFPAIESASVKERTQFDSVVVNIAMSTNDQATVAALRDIADSVAAQNPRGPAISFTWTYDQDRG